MMTTAITDSAGVMRATGLLRSFMAADSRHVDAIMAAISDGPTEQTLMDTFGALLAIAVLLTNIVAEDGAFGDVDQTLDAIQRQLIHGDVKRPGVAL
ncbi:MAG: hypothetical protein H7338_04190 [Candidatus Sericytochromatia bacterium]|nr:hypothetical protein [Candidatus Sericytochromatia bacterium]